jgi:predicted kinase
MNDKIPIFLMLIGIPGSGKSYWIEKNVNKDEFCVVSSDDIRKEITGDVSDLSQDKIMWQTVKERVVEMLSQGKNVILDATNVNGFYRRNFIKDLPCKLQAKRFDIDLETAKKRVINDIDNEVDRSHVPVHIIERMHMQFESYCNPTQLKKEGFEVID